jgi:hypothetical protein
MATHTTCDLCSTVLTRPRDKRGRLIAMCPDPQAGPVGPDDFDDCELHIDACKACLRRAIGMLRDCFGQRCSPEFVEASEKFLIATQDAPLKS